MATNYPWYLQISYPNNMLIEAPPKKGIRLMVNIGALIKIWKWIIRQHDKRMDRRRFRRDTCSFIVFLILSSPVNFTYK